MRDEDLAERDRRREHDLGEAVDPQELDVQVLGRRVEPFGDDARQPRCGDEDAAMLAIAISPTAPVSTVRPKSFAGSSPSSWRSRL